MMLSYFFGQSHLAEVDKKWAPMPISCNKRKVILLVKKSCQIAFVLMFGRRYMPMLERWFVIIPLVSLHWLSS